MAKSSKPEKKPIEQYDHRGKERCNNPPVGLARMERMGEIGSGGIVSLLFEAGKNRRIAVKIVDDRGNGSLKIVEVQ